MTKHIISLIIIVACLLTGYHYLKPSVSSHNTGDTIKSALPVSTDSLITGQEGEKRFIKDSLLQGQVNTGNISPDSIINFAQTLIGTPYLYASIDPQKGFDCSGFITYVFNHFKIQVPRSSYEFDNVGTTIPLAESKKGDLILFTGTDSSERRIGHMGIVLTNDNSSVTFIHSSSGKAHGVTVSPLDKYYQGRFMKVIRVFKSPL